MDFHRSNSRLPGGDIVSRLPAPPPIGRAKTGDPVIKISGVSLASGVDPVAEGRKFAQTADAAKTPNLLVYGFGLGYHLEPLLAALPPHGRLVVIEANLEILSAAMHYRDLSAVLGDPRFSLVAGTGDAEISGRLSSILSGGDDGWEILIHQPSYRCMPEGLDALKNIFETIRADRRFNANFGGRERENILANLEAVAASPGVSSLFGRLDGMPAVLVGAGPSLDRNLPLLERLKGRAFILGVDTAAEVLAANGIPFDAVISVDPQPVSITHFCGDDFPAPLVFLPSTHPSVVESGRGRRFLMLKDSHSFFGPAQNLLEDRGVSTAGGSVSCLALDLLIKMGADPIGFVGQDFAFPKGMPYNRLTLSAHPPDSPFADILTGSAAGFLILLSERLKIAAAGGGEGITHANLLGYLRTFERIIADNPRRAFFNINSSGAHIRGCRDIFSTAEAGTLFGMGKEGLPPMAPPPETGNPALAGRIRELLFEKE